jgi:hypothetical protein
VDLSHVLWIGGPPGSGTSTVAEALAERFGLQLYSVDAQTSVHEERMPATEFSTFLATSRHRFRLVLEDLRELPDEPVAIVEGPQLFPTSVSAVLRSPDQALFLLPERDELGIAETFEAEARDLRLATLRVGAPVAQMVERAAAHFAPVVERLSGAAGTSR